MVCMQNMEYRIRVTASLKGQSSLLISITIFSTTKTLFRLSTSSPMANVTVIIAIIGNIISILVFASPITTFTKVVKKKSIQNFKGDPYVCTLLSTSLWLFYGLIKPGGFLLATVNGAGALLQATFLTLYIIYAPRDTRIKYLKLAALLNVGFLGVVLLVVLVAVHGGVRLTILGFLCAGLTLGMYGSPLAAMKMVIKTRSVEYMPFFLSFFLTINAGVWTAYAVLVRDFFVGVPNIIGLVLGSAQLILYMIYRGKSGPAKPIEKLEDEGSAHLVQRDLELGKYKVQEITERNLQKVRSLPKSISRETSFKKMVKAHSLTPQEVQAIWPNEGAVDVK